MTKKLTKMSTGGSSTSNSETECYFTTSSWRMLLNRIRSH